MTMSSIGDAFRASLAAHGDRVALIEADRERENGRWTYAELGAEAERFAALLQAHGLGPGDRCALLMSNQFRWIATAMGTFLAGGVLVPMDSRAAPEEQLSLLRHAGPRVLVVEAPLWRRLAPLAGSLDGLVVIASESDSPDGTIAWDAAPPAAPRAAPRQPDDLATIVYSSGTAGVPKGCMLRHRTYLGQAAMVGGVFRIGIDDRYMSVLPTSHTTDFTVGFILPLLSGASIVHQRTMRPQFLSASMRLHEATYTVMVPALLRQFERRLRARLDEVSDWPARLVAHRESGPRPGELPAWLEPIVEAELGPRMRLILIGGAFVDRGLARFFTDLGLPVAIGYGLTEAGTVVSISDPRMGAFDGACRVLPGVEVDIREPAADGVGEVWIRTPTLMGGYLGDDELTSATLVDGWLRTGDLGSLEPDGRLRVVGRAKNMIVTAGGKNVYPEDIESHFAGIPGCAELCVFADSYLWPPRAMDGEALVAVVRPERGAELTAAAIDEIRRRNRELAEYRRLRATIAWSGPFPLTSSHKVRRDALADQLRALDRTSALRPLEG